MIYATPSISESLTAQLDELDALSADISVRIDRAVPWVGKLRRFERGRSYGSSIKIEGFSVDPDRAEAVASGLSSPDSEEDEQALFYYALAMDHVATLAKDDYFEWSQRAILDLHFEACRFQIDRRPGLYRTDAIQVTAPAGGGVAYEGPPFELVEGLCEELVSRLDSETDTHPAVAGAMAHLNLVSIHPFEDGNGRISRILQSLVLARRGVLAPEFGSIEQYLADNPPDYYDALMRVQRGSYTPENDATSWVEFCVAAHLDQVKRRALLIETAARRWEMLESMMETEGWDDRLIIALEQAISARTDRSHYAREAGVSPATASADLRRLADANYLDQVGSGRTTSYEPSATLRRKLDIDA